MARPVSAGAQQAIPLRSDFDDEVSGRFFASAPKKMTGPLQDLTEPRISDQASQEAVWNVIVGLAGGVGYPE